MFPIFSRAFADSLTAIDAGPKSIGLSVAVAIVTALIVLLFRGWNDFREHVIANIFIALAGVVAVWLCVFAYVCWHVPNKMQAEAKANLDKVIEEKRQYSMDINAQKDEIARLTNLPVVTRTVTLEQQRQCWFTNHFGFPNSKIEGAVSATTVIFHCNHKIEAPWIVEARFDRDFIPGGLVLNDSGGWFLGGGKGKQGLNYSAQINNPALLSDQIVTFTVYGTTDQYPRAVAGDIKSLN